MRGRRRGCVLKANACPWTILTGFKGNFPLSSSSRQTVAQEGVSCETSPEGADAAKGRYSLPLVRWRNVIELFPNNLSSSQWFPDY